MLFGTAEDKCAARRAWDHDWIRKAMLHNNYTLQPDSVVFGENKCNDTTLSFPQGRSFSQRGTDICWTLLFLLRPLSPALFILLFFLLLGSGCVQEMDKTILWECFSERPIEEDRLPAKHNRCSVAAEVWFQLPQILKKKDLSMIYTKRHFLLLFFTILSSHLLCTFLAFISSTFLYLTSSLLLSLWSSHHFTEVLLQALCQSHLRCLVVSHKALFWSPSFFLCSFYICGPWDRL